MLKCCFKRSFFKWILYLDVQLTFSVRSTSDKWRQGGFNSKFKQDRIFGPTRYDGIYMVSRRRDQCNMLGLKWPPTPPLNQY